MNKKLKKPSNIINKCENRKSKISNKIIKKANKKNRIKNTKRNERNINEKSSSINQIKIYNGLININEKIEDNIYNDNEINTLSYEEALKIDKRTYIQYYISLIKRKQIIIFTFFTNNDYNLRSIKICLFLFSFALDYTVNALFFNDSTMHKIYTDEGEYNFLYRLPNMLYSSLISGVISSLLEYLSMIEDKIIEIKNDKNFVNAIKMKKRLKIKFIIFFILDFLFLFAFWYYTCFGVVYKNTQIIVIKDTLISFIFPLLSPIATCLLPGIFRIISLRASKQDKECMYKFSQFIEDPTPPCFDEIC